MPGPLGSRPAPRRRAHAVLSAISGNWLLVGGFALIIAVGATLLRLPAAATGDQLTWGEALFTSTSAVSVTGLTVVNTATDLTRVGQLVVLALMQVGGVGFIAFSVLLFRLIGRRVTLEERFVVQQTLGVSGTGGVVRLTLYVLVITLTLEAIGALLLFLRWRASLPTDEAAYVAVFHAISAYCNAGFDLFSGTDRGVFFGYGTDWYSLGVLAALIVVGGLGITVVYDLWSYRSDNTLSLHTKLTLVMAFLLTAAGSAFLLADELFINDVLGGLDPGRRALVTVFTVISSRTAGLTIIPLDGLAESSQLLLMVWMFIGSAPASMGGGVSTSTVAVILVAVAAAVRGETTPSAFGRTLPAETVYKAIAVMTVSTLLVAFGTLMLVDVGTGRVFPVAFEVVSAFSNTGYSVGKTADLTEIGRILIALLMFWGRLGPLTLVVALAARSQPSLITYPEEPVILG